MAREDRRPDVDHGRAGRYVLAGAYGEATSEDSEDQWRVRAACRGASDIFFPDSQLVENLRPAQAICATCPVREPCLNWALDTNQEFGVWGGMTEGDRKRLRRRRYRAGRSAVAS